MRNITIQLFTYLGIIFMPKVPALLWLLFFIVVDVLTGIWKAKKSSQKIESKKLSKTITKIVVYFVTIVCAHVMDVELLHTTILPFTITQVVIGFISITEFKSIVENISVILSMPLDKYLRKKIDALLK